MELRMPGIGKNLHQLLIMQKRNGKSLQVPFFFLSNRESADRSPLYLTPQSLNWGKPLCSLELGAGLVRHLWGKFTSQMNVLRVTKTREASGHQHDFVGVNLGIPG